MRINKGRFSDAYRGDGYMISFGHKTGWLLFAFRPRGWHLRLTRVTARPAFRLYLGPFEIESYRVQP